MRKWQIFAIVTMAAVFQACDKGGQNKIVENNQQKQIEQAKKINTLDYLQKLKYSKIKYRIGNTKSTKTVIVSDYDKNSNSIHIKEITNNGGNNILISSRIIGQDGNKIITKSERHPITTNGEWQYSGEEIMPYDISVGEVWTKTTKNKYGQVVTKSKFVDFVEKMTIGIIVFNDIIKIQSSMTSESAGNTKKTSMNFINYYSKNLGLILTENATNEPATKVLTIDGYEFSSDSNFLEPFEQSLWEVYKKTASIRFSRYNESDWDQYINKIYQIMAEQEEKTGKNDKFGYFLCLLASKNENLKNYEYPRDAIQAEKIIKECTEWHNTFLKLYNMIETNKY